jgi:hypothetical protein
MYPPSIPALAAYVLEVEMRGPDVLGDVFDMYAMARFEVHGATRAWTSTMTVGPSTKDAAGALGCGVSVGGGEMMAEDVLVDGDVLATTVDHAAYDGRRKDLGNWTRVG